MSKRKGPNESESVASILADAERKALIDANREARRKYDKLLSELHQRDQHLSEVVTLKELVTKRTPKILKPIGDGKIGESVAVALFSDWHFEEKVDPKTVNGVNEYNPEIATARITRGFQRTLSMIDMFRSRSRIDTLILALLGDLITGYIHEELVEGNYLSPTQAMLAVYPLIIGGIDLFLKEGRFKEIVIPCSHGNHGRTTLKPRVSTSAANSYEWLLYKFVEMHYAAEPRVRFQIADGYHNFLKVYGKTIRFHHGDGIRYGGGVGDVDIPLNKAIAQWNKTQWADLDCLGHWHTRKNSRNFCLNSSLIGFNAYSIKIKASFEPPTQGLFLIHPARGKTIEVPLFLD